MLSLDSLLHQYFYLVGFYFTGRMITPENKNLASMDHDDQTIDNQVEYEGNLDEFSKKELYKYNNKIAVIVI